MMAPAPIGASNAERQLILISAGTVARRGAMGEQANRLMAGVNWTRLAETLRQRRLLPTLGPRMVELANGRASEDFRVAVSQAIETGRRHGVFLQLVSLRAIAMLAEAGIRSIALKGPLMGEAIYGDAGRRPSSDIDLLVAPSQLQAAVEVIRTLGYGAPTDYVFDSGLPLLHFALLHERRQLPAVELHWRVHWYERRFASERLVPPVVDPLGDWRPEPVDELAALLLFYARDGFIDLRLASDLSAWWDRYGAGMHDRALGEVVRAYPEFARVIRASLMVAEKMVGLPADRIMGDMHELGLRERLAVRLANPHPQASPSQLYADIGLIDGLLMPRGGFGRFVRRQVWPPAEVLDQQARHAARQRARSPLSRSAGVLARYSLTIARLARPAGTLR
jgi:Uncharacterised nucleotidyltransferase